MPGPSDALPDHPTAPIGRPIANTRAYVLDPQLQPTPTGVPGELYIGGEGLARGYLHRPELTAERFIPDPFSDQPGARMYRTGDLVRALPDGTLLFLGRVDHQVKVRGHRIELGEIEAVLHQSPLVREALVLARETSPGDTQLVAYVVPDLAAPDRVSAVRACSVGDGVGEHALTTVDISADGLALMGVPAGWRKGQRLRLRLDLPGALGGKWLRARVAWEGEGQAGVAFEPEPEQHALLAQAVAALPEAQAQRRAHRRTVIQGLQSHLKARLPAPMLPTGWVILDALPRLPNGKLDRHALPESGHIGHAEEGFQGPRTPREALLAQIWADVLRLDHVDIHAEFFALGGHSLLAAQVVSRVRQMLHIDIPLRALFDAPTVAGLAERLDGATPALPALTPLGLVEAPLSFGQQRLWVQEQLLPGGGMYTLALGLRVNGPLDPDALIAALRAVVRRHAVLRSRVVVRAGAPVQQVDPATDVTIQLLDLSGLPEPERAEELRRLAAQTVGQPIDLAAGPLLSPTLVKVAAVEHWLLLAIHHGAFDGWSSRLLLDELAAGYAAAAGHAPELPPLPVQYVDFAHWQRAWLQEAAGEQRLAYWRRQLDGAPALLELPTDEPRPARQGFAAASHPFAIGPELLSALHELVRREGVTLFMALLAAFQVLLHRSSGQDDIVVGTPVASRPRPELEGLIGFFVNTLALRSSYAPTSTFRELLRQTRETCLAAYAHQDLPLEQVIDALKVERDPGRHPLMQAMVVLQEPLEPARAGDAVSFELRDLGLAATPFDLTLEVTPYGEELQAILHYRTDLFRAETMTRMADRFLTLLGGLVAAPELPLADAPLLTASERRLLLGDWPVPAPAPGPYRPVHVLIAEQARCTPEHLAALDRDGQASYAELDQRAGMLAGYLQTCGVGRGAPVAILMEHSVAALVALLAVLRAGGVYVPLDPHAPSERLIFILEETGTRVMLTRGPVASALPGYSGQLIDVEQGWPAITTDVLVAEADTWAEEPAAIIYTSGSSGRPKGVIVTHGGLAAFTLAAVESHPFAAGERVLVLPPLTFDAAGEGIFPALAGGRVWSSTPSRPRSRGGRCSPSAPSARSASSSLPLRSGQPGAPTPPWATRLLHRRCAW